MKDNMENNTKTKCFLDTNILIYTYDKADYEKRSYIQDFLRKNKEMNELIISIQTLGEFFNVATKKMRLDKTNVISLCEQIMNMFPVYEITTENVFHAMKISESTQFSYWDSLILAMAIDTGCSILYSEDLNNGQEIEGVKIVNPFAVA